MWVWVVRRVQLGSALETHTIAVRATLDGARQAAADDVAPTGPELVWRQSTKTWFWATDPVDGLRFTAEEFQVGP